MNYTTDAYRQAVVKVLIENANQLAGKLHLNEELPIQETNLVETYISSPLLADASGNLGAISTRKYSYFCGTHGICSVVRSFGRGDSMADYWERLRKKYGTREISIDTNAALKLATQWLVSASCDLPALLHDTEVKIYTGTDQGRFLGFYVVQFGDSAEVQLVEPECALIDLTISKARYKKGEELSVTNRDWLLQQTDDPKMREIWQTTDAYKKAALLVMLKEANGIARKLRVPQKLPIRTRDVLKTRVETPFLSDHLGCFAAIYTKEYIFNAAASNKLGYINKNFQFHDEDEYREALKQRYTLKNSEINTNAAYMLAMQWLASISADVKSLQRDCHSIIKWWDLGDGKFVPLYTIEWRKSSEFVATVELVLPDKALKKLWVEKPEYLRRGPLSVAHRDRLLNLAPH